MSAEVVIKTLLDSSASVAALAGSRIYSLFRPEGDPLPAIVHVEISDLPVPPIDITVGAEPMMARIQVNCLGRTSVEVKSLKDAVIAACHKRSGVIGGITVQAVVQDAPGPRSYDAVVDTCQQSVDFIVNYLR